MIDKNVILVEALVNRAGIEREVLAILRHNKNTDVYAGIYDPDSTFKEFKDYNIHYFLKKKLPPVINTAYLRHKFRRFSFPEYKNYIIIGIHSMKAAKKYHPNVWYCNAPLKHIYEEHETELQRMNLFKGFIFRIFAFFLRRSDQKCFKHLDKVLVSSKRIQKRIERDYNNHKSSVLYPPVDTKNFRFSGQKDYYLIASRIAPEKNVDLVVKAFQKMPDKKLVIAGHGPDEEKIKKMIKNYKNIEFIGPLEGKRLYEVYGNCIAMVYVTTKEDFGIVAPEAMAAGKPCIGASDGGMKESIIEKRTGLLVSPDVSEIVEAVKYLTPKKALQMRSECEKRAEKFSEESFVRGINSSLK